MIIRPVRNLKLPDSLPSRNRIIHMLHPLSSAVGPKLRSYPVLPIQIFKYVLIFTIENGFFPESAELQ